MSNLWKETIEGHRQEVRDAVVETAAALVNEHGLLSVTMSQIAEGAGIGRATLYKYFSGVEEILLAWHERQITAHLRQLVEIRNRAADPAMALEAVLEAFAAISRESHFHEDTELAAFLHRDGQVTHAWQELRDMIRALLVEGAAVGAVRDDVPAIELANYCLRALSTASDLPSKAAVRRLVRVTLDGLGARA